MAYFPRHREIVTSERVVRSLIVRILAKALGKSMVPSRQPLEKSSIVRTLAKTLRGKEAGMGMAQEGEEGSHRKAFARISMRRLVVSEE